MLESSTVTYHDPCFSGRKSQQSKRRLSMNKYELAVVLSAAIDDEARAAALQKAQDYITRAGGTITNPFCAAIAPKRSIAHGRSSLNT